MKRVFVHGFTGSAEVWRDIATGEDVCLTLPGHLEVPCHWKNFADATEWLWQQLPDEPVHVIGYSLGARILLGMLIEHPTIAKATFISVNPGLTTNEERKERLIADQIFYDLLMNEGIEAFTQKWLQQKILQPVRPITTQPLWRLKHQPLALAQCFKATGLATMPNYWPLLHTLQMPVHFICGAHDIKFCALAEKAVQQLPRSYFSKIALCGHNPILEAPEELQNLLTFNINTMNRGKTKTIK